MNDTMLLWAKGGVSAALSGALVALADGLTTGKIEWKIVATGAIVGLLAYLKVPHNAAKVDR